MAAFSGDLDVITVVGCRNHAKLSGGRIVEAIIKAIVDTTETISRVSVFSWALFHSPL